MSWQLFTVIQIAAFAMTALAALWLRNRQLRARNDELLGLCTQAHEELVNVTGKLAEVETTAPPEKLLAERVKGLDGTDDPVMTVRRLVLENEIKPSADFAERLGEHLASQQPDEEEFARRWRAIRSECHQLAMFLVADKPECLEPFKQIFEVVEPLDQAYGIELPELEVRARAEEPEAGDGEDGGEQLDQAALDALLAGDDPPDTDGDAAGEPEDGGAAPESSDEGSDLQTGTG